MSGVSGGHGASGDDKRVKRGTRRARRRPVEGAPRVGDDASRDGKRRAPARGAGRSRGSIRGGARRRDPGRNARRTDGDVHEGVADDGELDRGAFVLHGARACVREPEESAREGGRGGGRRHEAGRTNPPRFRRDAARADDERRHDVSTALRTFLKSIDQCEPSTGASRSPRAHGARTSRLARSARTVAPPRAPGRVPGAFAKGAPVRCRRGRADCSRRPRERVRGGTRQPGCRGAMAFAWDAASLRATVEDRSAVMRAFKLANSGASSRASRDPVGVAPRGVRASRPRRRD